MSQSDLPVLIDSDIIIHFFKGGGIIDLPQILDGELYILNIVYDELNKQRFQPEINNLFSYGLVEEMEMPTDNEIIYEFARLNDSMGDGESACLAVTRYRDYIIASGNLNDIAQYCQEFNIPYKTTLDILAKAHSDGYYSAARCNEFINKVRNQGSKLPDTTIHDYIRQVE